MDKLDGAARTARQDKARKWAAAAAERQMEGGLDRCLSLDAHADDGVTPLWDGVQYVGGAVAQAEARGGEDVRRDAPGAERSTGTAADGRAGDGRAGGSREGDVAAAREGDVLPGGGNARGAPRHERHAFAGRSGLVAWKDVREPEDDAQQLWFAVQLEEDTRMYWYKRACRSISSVVEESWLSDGDKQYAYDQVQALLREPPQVESVPAATPHSDRYALASAFRLLADRLPQMVDGAERRARVRRRAGERAAAGVRMAAVVAQAVIAYRAYEDEFDNELEWYRHEIPRLQAEAERWAEYEERAAAGELDD